MFSGEGALTTRQQLRPGGGEPRTAKRRCRRSEVGRCPRLEARRGTNSGGAETAGRDSQLLVFVKDAPEVLLEHVLPFLSGGDTAGFVGSHHVVSIEAAAIWRRKLAARLASESVEEGLKLKAAEEMTAAEWNRAYRRYYLFSRLFEGELDVDPAYVEDIDFVGVYPLGNTSYVTLSPNSAKLHDALTGKVIRAFHGDLFSRNLHDPLHFIPLNHSECIAKTLYRDITVWDTLTGICLRRLDTLDGYEHIVKMNDKQVLTASDAHVPKNSFRITLIDVASLSCLNEFECPSYEFHRVLSDTVLVTVRLDPPVISAFDVNSGKCILCIKDPHRNGALADVMRINDGFFLSISRGEVKEWCLWSGRCVKTFRLTQQGTLCSQIVINDRLLAFVDSEDECEVCFCDIETGEIMEESVSPEVEICELVKLSEVSFATRLSRDGSVFVWKIPFSLPTSTIKILF